MDKILLKLPKIHKIPDVNYGGCGFVALYLHKTFTRHGIESTIIGLADHKLSLREVPNHFVVRVGGKFYDSRGETEVPHHVVKTLFSEDALTALLAREREWNPWFDRKRVRIIRATLDSPDMRLRGTAYGCLAYIRRQNEQL